MPITKVLTSKAPIEGGVDYVKNPDKTTVLGDSDLPDVDATLTMTLPAPENNIEFVDNREDTAVAVSVTDDEIGICGFVEAIEYAQNDAKTVTASGSRLVSGINCSVGGAVNEMLSTKRRYAKERGRTYYHLIQALKPGEGTPEEVHRLGVETAMRLFGDRFEVLVATHLDQPHLHNHFIINSVSFADGRKLHIDKSFYYNKIRRISDELSQAFGYSVIRDAGNSGAHIPDGAPSWRKYIQRDVDLAMRGAGTWEVFLSRLRQMGYRIKNGERISVQPPGNSEKYFRLDRLTKDGRYAEAEIKRAIAEHRSISQDNSSEHEKKPIRTYRARNYHARKKLHGWRAQYARYCYLLGVYKPRTKKTWRTAEQVAAAKYLLHIEQHTALLIKYRIDTAEQLDEHEQGLRTELAELQRARSRLRGRLGRSPEDVKTQEEYDRVRARIKAVLKEVKLCGEIKARSERLYDEERQQQKLLERM